MSKLTRSFTRVAWLFAAFSVSACGLPPTVADGAHGVPIDKTEGSPGKVVQTASNGIRIGRIENTDNARTGGCKKQRRTGSHLFRVDCADPDAGSQPVRSGDYWDLRHLTMSGSVRPE